MVKETQQKIFSQHSNPLNKEKKSVYDAGKIYSEDDKKYLMFLQKRLTDSFREHTTNIKHYNDQSRRQYYEDCERLANTFLPKKQEEDDVIVSSGSIENKLDALLSNIHNLNLAPDVFAFDKNNQKLDKLGKAIEDIIEVTEKTDGGIETGDAEKKMLRHRDLLKYGTVFVQEQWLKRYETKKKLEEEYDGKFKGVKWTSKLEKVFEGPSRDLIPGLNVFYGDLGEFTTENQPFIFFIKKMSYEKAKSIFGKFENFKYVKQGTFNHEVADNEKSIYGNNWRLTKELKQDEVEVVYYQDQPNDEFQIILNGTLLLPIGFPLSAVSPGGRYNITKQVFRVLNSSFPYGGAFVKLGSIKEVSELIDEMLKLFVLKTRKSYTPPYANVSGRIVSRNVLKAGRISMIDPNILQPIGQESQGITNGEVVVLQQFQQLLNNSTIAPTFTGQSAEGDQTATEVLRLEERAELALGLTIASISLLENKLAYLRLYNIIENWTKPIGEKLVTINDVKQYVKTFRNVSKEDIVDGGRGERRVILSEAIPSGETGSELVRDIEREEENRTGRPVEIIVLNPSKIRDIRITWYIEINSKQKNSDSLKKLLFREMVADAISLANLGSKPNPQGLEEEFGRIWDVDKSKIFQNPQPVDNNPIPEEAQDGNIKSVTPNQIGPDQQPGRSGGNGAIASALRSGALSSGI